MKLEALWIICNLAYGTDIADVMIDQGLMKVLNSLINTQDLVMLDQILYILGNISGEGRP